MVQLAFFSVEVKLVMDVHHNDTHGSPPGKSGLATESATCLNCDTTSTIYIISITSHVITQRKVTQRKGQLLQSHNTQMI